MLSRIQQYLMCGVPDMEESRNHSREMFQLISSEYKGLFKKDCIGKEQDDATSVIPSLLSRLREEMLEAANGEYLYSPFDIPTVDNFDCTQCDNTTRMDNVIQVINVMLFQGHTYQNINLERVIKSHLYQRKETDCFSCGSRGIVTTTPDIYRPDMIVVFKVKLGLLKVQCI